MEPGTSLVTALAAKSGEAAVEVAKEEAKGFLKQLFGPSAEAIGEDLALRHRERLFNNLVEVLSRAKKRLKAKSVTVHELPLKILHPLLESASLEEDPEIQEMWANLVAGVATDGKELFYSAYIQILKQLSTEEARFLNLLYDQLQARMTEYTNLPPEKQGRNDPTSRLGTFEDFHKLFVEANQIDEPEKGDFVMVTRLSLGNLCRLGVLNPVRPEYGPYYSIDPFAVIFLVSCCDKSIVQSCGSSE
jgi:hypothetical protein